jgi:hypothetical protein
MPFLRVSNKVTGKFEIIAYNKGGSRERMLPQKLAS